MNNFTMFIPTRTLFGSGTLGELHAQTLPGKKAMLVISNGKSTLDNGYLSRTKEQLALVGGRFARAPFRISDCVSVYEKSYK